ncbi:MAG: hypothetical protein GY822_18480 [Deltaproteobacteria bacterium]|nr:hypothetical protein [Deltaproteobacteria bacterium]
MMQFEDEHSTFSRSETHGAHDEKVVVEGKATRAEQLKLLVQWLIKPGAFPSRNQHFEEYKDLHFQELTRRCRRLKGLVDDLRAAHPSPVDCVPDDDIDGQWWFSFSFSLALGAVKRDTRLEKDDVELLLRALEGTPMHKPFSAAWDKAS